MRPTALALVLAGVTLGHLGALHLLDAPPAHRDQGLSKPHPIQLRTAASVSLTEAAPTKVAPAPAPAHAAPIATPSAPGTAHTTSAARRGPGEWGAYVPAHQLDWPALPRSAPDTAMLNGQSLSGLPLTLRLYIDAQGRVTAVRALQLADDDCAALPALQAMFEATAYSPGRQHGRDVASTLDLALGVEPAPDAEPPAATLQHAAAH